MGEALISRRGGGGGGKSFAVIHAEYPAGSVCTCTNGTKTLKAKDTSGLVNFLIPEAGTWTVTASDGSRTKSSSVNAATEGGNYSVKLTYAFVVYKNGVSKAGNFKSTYSTRAKVTLTSSYILYEPSDSDYSAFGAFPNKVDLTNFDTLVLDVYRDGIQYGNAGYFGPSTHINEGVAPSFVSNVYIPNPGKYNDPVRSTLTLDISSITGSYYLALNCNDIDLRIYEVRLE